MRNAFTAFISISIFLFSGCPSTESVNSGLKVENEFRDTQDHLISATLFVQRSAEYRALCYQAYAAATNTLLQEVEKSTGRNLAIITDLDETVLDNSAYTGWQIANENPYTSESWKLWTEKQEARLVPGALEFLQLADSHGVRIYYVSNRNADALESTMSNMKQLGLPQVLTDQFYLRTTTSNKVERREAIENGGEEVILYLGDNLADFNGVWEKYPIETRAARADSLSSQFGRSYIIFPNPVYGTWESGLYNFDRSIEAEQRDSIRRSLLHVADLD